MRKNNRVPEIMYEESDDGLSITDYNYIKDKYFFIDKNFKRTFYHLDANGSHVVNSDYVVLEYQVFTRITTMNGIAPGIYVGTAFLDTNDESGYVKWQRYKTVVTLTCTNHYTSSVPYWNVTFKLAKASPIVDGDPIIGAFMMNLVYSAIRGQNEIRLESGYSGGSITLGDHTTDSVTGNTTAPYGANDWGGNLGTWLKQYCKSMYCDSMLENPYDAFYLTKIAGNTNWNSLTGTDTPQYKYRNFY